MSGLRLPVMDTKEGIGMARNKHPEVTIEKILEVAQKLFLEKGYDKTTIQDIVDELGGLTKGAIYHHFKSKEDIMGKLNEKMFCDNSPLAIVKQRQDLNGLQKLREAIRMQSKDMVRAALNAQSILILKNPYILASMIESSRKWVSPVLCELIEEGNRDGSIQTAYAKELSEVVQLLTGLWMAPSIYPTTAEEMQRKLVFLKEMLDCMGAPLLDDEMMGIVKEELERL